MSSPELNDPNARDMLGWLYAMRDRLPQFVVYDHPEDFPQGYVARLWLTLPENVATAFTMRCVELAPIQDFLESLGMVKLYRSPDDQPHVLETWI